jgi:hypothetical protein
VDSVQTWDECCPGAWWPTNLPVLPQHGFSPCEPVPSWNREPPAFYNQCIHTARAGLRWHVRMCMCACVPVPPFPGLFRRTPSRGPSSVRPWCRGCPPAPRGVQAPPPRSAPWAATTPRWVQEYRRTQGSAVSHAPVLRVSPTALGSRRDVLGMHPMFPQ